MKKLTKAIKNPFWALSVVLRRLLSKYIKDDSLYIKWEYFLEMRKNLNLNSPQTYNEKLQWLKLNDIHPEYTNLVDKVEVKKIVARAIGEEHVIKTLGVWDSFEDVNFDALPDMFVLKTSHDSGGVAICRDKRQECIKAAQKKIEKSMRRNYFWEHREYPYRDVKPRIIAEQYMVDESGTELKDYKIFCFDGEPKVIQVDYDRFTEHKRNLYDIEWNRLPFTLKFPTDWSREIPKPEGLQEMLDMARKLSEGMPHVRVDLYHINGKIYFGELTFFHGSGHEKFTPEEWNMTFGEWIHINK